MTASRFVALRLLTLTAVLPAILSAQPAGYPIAPVLFTDVRVDDDFWSRRLEVNRSVSIPHALAQCEETGRVRNFETADSVLRGLITEGKFCGRYGFDDSDVFKVLEGVAYALQTRYDPALDARADSLIEKIGGAQEADGYLYTMRTIDPEASWAPERWVNDRIKGSHELYNLGHLYEAAVAHFYATGKRNLLDIALRTADLLVATFGPDRMHTAPGHQVTEIGLVKLYQVTGNRAYLDLAEFFIHERGRGNPEGSTYNQDHIPVLEQTEAVGHAVRAGYLYAGMADVAAWKEGTEYLPVLEKLWEDVVSHKLYITGGVGAVGNIEGYGARYQLPNRSAYCETCAGIALVYWSHRMFLHTGDARYLDVVERVLYNGFLSGVGMSGDRFFYPNPLESIAGAERSPWFTCACCPSNDVRFVASLPGYVYATGDRSLYVNLYVGGSATVRPGRLPVEIRQRSRYPWSGAIAITLTMSAPDSFGLRLRIPGWASGRPVPSSLYAYRDEIRPSVTLSVNGEAVPLRAEQGFAVVARTWRSGDVIALDIPMPVHRVMAHDSVAAGRGKVALERGPIVYCLESPDQGEPWLLDTVIPDTATIQSSFRPSLLGGVQILSGRALTALKAEDGTARPGSDRPFVAIPYYAWAHRGPHQMTVWPARTLASAHPAPLPTLAFRSAIATSGGRNPEALKDQFIPASSHDPDIPNFNWWPKKGTTEWVLMHFPDATSVRSVTVHWLDDTGEGECRLPRSWEIQYHDGREWTTVSNPSDMDVDLGAPSVITFDPVTTTDLRLMVTLREGYSAGIYEWSVE